MDASPLKRRSISELVTYSGLSKSLLTSGFRERYGETIHGYQNRKCILATEDLLRQGMLIKTVAITAGFKKQGNFTRTFTAVMGITPSQYQAENKPH